MSEQLVLARDLDDPETLVMREMTVQVLEMPADELVVLEESGLQGPPGPVGVGEQGPAGPVGPPGPQGIGTGARLLEQTFATPLATWVISHGLGTKAIAVSAFDPDGETEKEGEVTFPDFNTVVIDFYYPEAGIARLLY